MNTFDAVNSNTVFTMGDIWKSLSALAGYATGCKPPRYGSDSTTRLGSDSICLNAILSADWLHYGDGESRRGMLGNPVGAVLPPQVRFVVRWLDARGATKRLVWRTALH
jgi:hypothetical protein